MGRPFRTFPQASRGQALTQRAGGRGMRGREGGRREGGREETSERVLPEKAVRMAASSVSSQLRASRRAIVCVPPPWKLQNEEYIHTLQWSSTHLSGRSQIVANYSCALSVVSAHHQRPLRGRRLGRVRMRGSADGSPCCHFLSRGRTQCVCLCVLHH